MRFVRPKLVVLFILLAMAVAAAPVLAADASFGVQEVLPLTLTEPADFAVGDLDNDGDADIVALSTVDGRLVRFPNLGGAEFGPENEIDSGLPFSSVALADINRDGLTDVVVGTDDGSAVLWYRNLGPDGFDLGGADAMVDGTAGRLVATADIDGDGSQDVIAGVSGGIIRVYFNSGGVGTFPSSEVALAGSFDLDSIFPVDLDRNGRIDLLVAGQESEGDWNLAWLDRTGPGDWVVNVIDSGSEIASAVAGDVNRDGHLDVVAAFEGSVVWYENAPEVEEPDAFLVAGGADFPFDPDFIVATETIFNDVQAVDLDGDARLDVVASAIDGVYWFRQADGFEFPPAITEKVEGTGVLQVADADDDGDVDVLSAYTGDGKISLYRNRKLHRRAITTGEQAVNLGNAASVDAADLDGDGDLDLVSTDVSIEALLWHPNFGDGTFEEPVPIETIDDVRSVRAADIDRDGNLDVVAAARDEGRLSWHANPSGAGPDVTESITDLFQDSFEQVRVADIDGDGDLDVLSGSGFFASAAAGTSNLSWWENDGAPASDWLAFAIDNFGDEVTGIEVADLDQDGDLDVIAGASTFDCKVTGEIAWYRNLGPEDIPSSLIDRADNRDSSGPRSRSARTIRRGPDDSTAHPVELESGTPSSSSSPPAPTVAVVFAFPQSLDFDFEEVNGIGSADIDGDGDVDVLAAWDSRIAWYENRLNEGGEVEWSEQELTNDISQGRWVDGADLDNDGDLDVIVAEDLGFAWLENLDGAGNFGPLQSIGFIDGGPAEVLAADLDADGDLDIVGASPGAQEGLFTYRNEGGQFALSTLDVAPDAAFEGETVELLAITVIVNGRSGDAAAELAVLSVGFQEGEKAGPLDSAQANALFENLRIYRDQNGNGQLEEGLDTLVETIETLELGDGLQTIVLPEDQSDLIVTAPATFLLVGELTDDASSSAPGFFQVLHDLQQGVAENADSDDRLDREFSSQTLFVSGGTSVAATYRVDSSEDVVDAEPGDGVCATIDGECTLRAAVQEANATPGDNLIKLTAALSPYVLTLEPDELDEAGGDLDVTGPFDTLKIQGEGAASTVIESAVDDRVIDLRFDARLALDQLTIAGGTSGQVGGGILQREDTFMSIDRCVIRDNFATVGGGLYQDSPAFLTVKESAFTGNESSGSGGAFVVFGNADFSATTVANNTGGFAGAFANDGGILTFTRGTISGNASADAVVRNFSLSQTTMTSTTVSDNSGGGLEADPDGSFNVGNALIAENDGSDLVGAFNSLGYNLIGNAGDASGFVDGQNGDQVGDVEGGSIVPLIAPLADNGGPTLTHALLAGSPAIDQGNCPEENQDQRRADRPVDLPVDDAQGGNGCDIGSFELEFATVVAPLEVPVRWCAVAGAPSVVDPTLVGSATVSDVLLDRLDGVNDNIFLPRAAMRFRSGATEAVGEFPILPDLQCNDPQACPVQAPGAPGDVFIDPETANFDEFLQLIALCRRTWQQLDPRVVGVTAVHVNQFVDGDGNPLPILGLGGRAGRFNPVEQIAAGRLMVVDNFFRPEDRLLGHELGHAVSLEHGNGIDDDDDGFVDNDDDPKFKFDGDNLMQYRNDSKLSTAQVEQARTHAFVTIPDSRISLSGMLTDEGTIDPGFGTILDFGFGTILDFELEDVQEFGMGTVLDFGFGTILDFGLGTVLDFGFGTILDFGFGTILDFGMVLGEDASTGEGTTTLVSSTGGVFWPSPIRPNQKVLFYVDVDPGAGTGGFPGDFGFPGAGIAEQQEVDLIVQVAIGSSCTELACLDEEVTQIFRFIDEATGYLEDPDASLPGTEEEPTITSLTVGLVVDNGGEELELDDQKMAGLVRARFKSSALADAGAQLGSPIALEALSVVDCVSDLPGGATTIDIECQCDDCLVCPDFPGCAQTGTPITVPDEIVTDCVTGTITFDPPALPACTLEPTLVEPGGSVTVTALNFPDGDLRLFLGDELVVPSFPSNPGEVTIAIPAGTTAAQLPITVDPVTPGTGLVGICDLTINANACGDSDLDGCDDCSIVPPPGDPANDGADLDGDGLCDFGDPDDDNDGVLDPNDSNKNDPFQCGSSDGDACDDCSSGGFDIFNDGDDFDGDGECDFGDPDDDNDGTDDLQDPDDNEPTICGDLADGDTCDDCSSGVFDPANDGTDGDGDGICAGGDPDDTDPFVCGDRDADGCDDCTLGSFDPANDGDDGDGDGICDVSDDCTDADGDGLGNGNLENAGCIDPTTDSDDANPFVCADTNANGCDDCGSGTFDPDNDLIDGDGDGVCDSVDNCPDVANPGQEDFDGDGEGDACETLELSVALSPDVLWPPNHQMVTIQAEVTTNVSPDAVSVVLAEIVSDEPDNGPGDGNTVNDIQGHEIGTPDFEFQLRAERSGQGDGRTYTVTYSATLTGGEAVSASSEVNVPHDQGD